MILKNSFLKDDENFMIHLFDESLNQQFMGISLQLAANVRAPSWSIRWRTGSCLDQMEENNSTKDKKANFLEKNITITWWRKHRKVNLSKKF